MGLYENKSVDYPDYAHPVAEAVEKESRFWYPALRQRQRSMYYRQQTPGHPGRAGFPNRCGRKLIRQHNDANVICIPARFVALEYAKADGRYLYQYSF